MELDNQGLMGMIDKNAIKKTHLFENSIPKYIVRSMFAGMYLTIGTAISVVAAEKANHIHPDLGKFVYAILFSWALIMIIYMDAELGTSNMMYLTVGVNRKTLKARRALQILLVCIFSNLVGGALSGLLIVQTGPFLDFSSSHYLAETVSAKLLKPGFQVIIEGIFANIIVNTAIISSARMKDDAGKLLAVQFIIAFFAFLGYEHVIANFSSFAMVFFAGGVPEMTTTAVLSNWFFATIGNYIGGGLVIGCTYAWLNKGETVYFD
ncbi:MULTISPECIES: formate/nitrite transporter family protein [unclassified Jeotgalibaca]|uniref:formate/nitrite transporter family protein n=1 Tax=unclassified Jeotgalibaca TaxID=2621505 RepID=UPI003FD61D8B